MLSSDLREGVEAARVRFYWDMKEIRLSVTQGYRMAVSPGYGYDSHIGGDVRSANIADLRNHLTQYLKEVRAGQEIIVRDRQRPIAKIVPLTVDDELAADAALIAGGLIRKGERPLPASFWKVRRGSVTRRAAAAAVSQDRDER